MPALQSNGEHWEPTPADVEWMERHLAHLKQGGFWFTSWAVYRVDHETHSLVLINGDVTSAGHARIATVLRKMKWMMIELQPPLNDDPPFGKNGELP